MKRLLSFAALFSLAMWLFGWDDIKSHLDTARIESAPSYAPVQVLRTYKTSKRKLHAYIIDYGFHVDGKNHRTSTLRIDEEGVARFLSRTDMQAVYYTHDPAINTLKQYYDLRHTRGTLGQSIVLASLISTAFALTIMLSSLLLRWTLGKVLRLYAPP